MPEEGLHRPIEEVPLVAPGETYTGSDTYSTIVWGNPFIN